MSHSIEHPDDLELELSRLGEADASVEAHVASCTSCAARRRDLDGLAASLRGPTQMVPREREEAILAGLRQRMAEIGRRRRIRRMGSIAAIAASVVVGGVLVSAIVGRRDDDVTPVASHQSVAREARDVNGDGRLDILDAFALARALQLGPAAGPDVTGDGIVDRADVDALAAAAVSLDGRT